MKYTGKTCKLQRETKKKKKQGQSRQVQIPTVPEKEKKKLDGATSKTFSIEPCIGAAVIQLSSSLFSSYLHTMFSNVLILAKIDGAEL